MKREIRLSTLNTLLEKWPLLVLFELMLGIFLGIISYRFYKLNFTQILLLVASFTAVSFAFMHIGVYRFKIKYEKKLKKKQDLDVYYRQKREDLVLETGCVSSWQLSTKARILKFDNNSFKLIGDNKLYYTFEELEQNQDLNRILKLLYNDKIREIDDEFYLPELKKWFIVRGRCVDSDISLEVNQFIGIIIDDTERRNHLKRMELLSSTDELTGLKNRRYFFEIFQNELNHFSRTRKVFTVALFDLDYFKRINDTWGHLAGDYVLKEFSKMLKALLRPYDHVARFGGEEFIVLFPDTDKEQAKQIVQRLKIELTKCDCIFESQKIPYTFSCGIGDVSELSLYTEKEFITIIDARLYDAKHSGRNLIVSGG